MWTFQAARSDLTLGHPHLNYSMLRFPASILRCTYTTISGPLSSNSLFANTPFINGQFISPDSSSSQSLQVLNPSHSSPIATVQCAASQDVADACGAASNAFLHWRSLPPSTRADYIDALYRELISSETSHDIASIITAENGKPMHESRGEVTYAANYLKLLRNATFNSTAGTSAHALDTDNLSMIIRQPIGPVLAITPWNFPLAMLCRKVAPALAAGCTVISKPSEETPLSALAFANIVRKVEIPPGVINVLPMTTSDSPRHCQQIIPNVRMLSFTGSTKVGKALQKSASENLLKTSMELGGNAPMIVCGDAHIPSVIDGIIANKLRNAGQSCVSINRLFVHESIEHKVLDALTQRLEKICMVGSGYTPGVTIGPLINKCAANRVRALIDDAVQLGATVNYRYGGEILPDSAFVTPVLLSNVPDTALLMREEIFGPVLAVQTFKCYESVLKKANDTEYGLAAYVYSADTHRAIDISRKLEVGMVGVNSVSITDARTCFGGVKQSGVGREGSQFALEDYQEAKHILLNHRP